MSIAPSPPSRPRRPPRNYRPLLDTGLFFIETKGSGLKPVLHFARSDHPTTDVKSVADRRTHQRVRRLRRSMLGSSLAWIAGET